METEMKGPVAAGAFEVDKRKEQSAYHDDLSYATPYE